MLKWELWQDPGTLSQWDNRLAAFDDRSIYQTMAWGEYRRALGWTPYRWAAVDNGNVVAMAQGLLRRYAAGVGLLWLPGGPVGDVAAWNTGLQSIMRRSVGIPMLYCRFNAFKPLTPAAADQLPAARWTRPRARLGTGRSLLYDVSHEETARVAATSRNWRHNLKRSRRGEFTTAAWATPDAAEMRAVYAGMEDRKNLALQHSERELRALYDHLAPQLITYGCRDTGGALLAFRACGLFAGKAWDLLAATSAAGRRVYASYAAFWALTEDCHRRGIGQYDLSGVDPVGNRGVYDFKQGTGASAVEYLGEWEWASPSLLSLPVNWMIGLRGRAP